MNLRFLNEYGEFESVEPVSWPEALGVSAPGLSGEIVLSIVTLSSIFFSLFFWFFMVLVE